MEPPLSKIMMTSRGYVYTYIYIKPAKNEAPWLLFLHGFPSSSKDWRNQVQFFSQRGYGIIAPDLLGYGGTSKPSDVQAYRGKDMANDVIEILDHENIPLVIGIGHDWGSFMLSRLANYYPQRFSKYVFLDVGYSAPNHALTIPTLKHVNAAVQAALGYSTFGYFLFFNDPDAAELMNSKVESVGSLFYAADDELGKKYLGQEGGFRIWLTEGKTAEWPDYLSSADIAHFKTIFSPENGGFGPGINWYRAQLQNINEADEKAIAESNHKLTHPTLLLTGSKNFISSAAQFADQMKPFVTELEAKTLESGHWIQLEKAQEVNGILEAFCEGGGE